MPELSASRCQVATVVLVGLDLLSLLKLSNLREALALAACPRCLGALHRPSGSSLSLNNKADNREEMTMESKDTMPQRQVARVRLSDKLAIVLDLQTTYLVSLKVRLGFLRLSLSRTLSKPLEGIRATSDISIVDLED
jgi:hypothetical protein